MSDESEIRDIAKSVKGIVEAVPIYQDVIQPAAKEIGTALQTVAKTIHIALAPVSMLVWGYEQIKDFVSTKVAEKLKDVPPENIASPKPNVAGPALESLRYTGHEEMLRDMYANLLAASMDTRTASGAHPAFVEIIRQFTPDEARLLRLLSQQRSFPLVTVRREYKVETPDQTGGSDVLVNFSLLGWEAGCDCPQLTPVYIDNLCRLGLTEVPENYKLTKPGIYDPLEKHPEIEMLKAKLEETENWKAVITKKSLRLTPLGDKFCQVCVISHDQKGLPKRTDI